MRIRIFYLTRRRARARARALPSQPARLSYLIYARGMINENGQNRVSHCHLWPREEPAEIGYAVAYNVSQLEI